MNELIEGSTNGVEELLTIVGAVKAAPFENVIRFGSFATAERSADENTLVVRLDSGKVVELDNTKFQQIDYGHGVEAARGVSADASCLAATPPSSPGNRKR